MHVNAKQFLKALTALEFIDAVLTKSGVAATSGGVTVDVDDDMDCEPGLLDRSKALPECGVLVAHVADRGSYSLEWATHCPLVSEALVQDPECMEIETNAYLSVLRPEDRVRRLIMEVRFSAKRDEWTIGEPSSLAPTQQFPSQVVFEQRHVTKQEVIVHLQKMVQLFLAEVEEMRSLN